jgi:hypothetical protein
LKFFMYRGKEALTFIRFSEFFYLGIDEK